MRTIRWKPLALFAAALTLAISSGGPSRAQEGHEHGEHEGGDAGHGGITAEAQGHQFEVVFERGGLRVYPRGPQVSPTAVSGLKGRAYFLMPGATKYSESYPLQPLAPAPGQPADSFGLAVALGRVPAEGTRVTFQVWPLPEAPESTARFTVPFALNDAGTNSVSRATRADQAAINAQKTCVGLLVADLSGHNVAAALHTAMVRSIVWHEAEQARSPAEVR